VGLAPTGKAPPSHGEHPKRTLKCEGELEEISLCVPNESCPCYVDCARPGKSHSAGGKFALIVSGDSLAEELDPGVAGVERPGAAVHFAPAH